MIDILVYLAVFVIVIILVWWLLQQVSLPEPLHKMAMIVLVVVGAVVLIGLLLHLTGVGPPLRLR
jgi:heme A synthase